MTETRIKFYADTVIENNQFFCYSFPELYPKDAIFRQFARGFNIRALWVEKIDKETGEVHSNLRVKNLEELWNEFVNLSERERQKYYPKKKHRIKRSF